MMDSKEQLLIEEAARWRARLASPECSDEERRAFDRWLASSPEHRAASARADAVNHGLAQLVGAADPELLALAEQALRPPSSSASPRVAASAAPKPDRRRWLALAAGVAALGAGVALFGRIGSTASQDYASGGIADGHRQVALADGSVVDLDVDSEVRVTIGERERRVELLRGRGMFAVAKDPSRPFVVVAGATETVALGTRFQVDRAEESVAVTLAEGSVSVTGSGPVAGLAEVLVPGEQLRYRPQPRLWQRQTVDLQQATAWLRGRLVFHETPLGEALADINRYSGKRIQLADAALGSLPISGNFIAGQSDAVVSALVEMLPVVASERDGLIVISAR